MRKRLKEGLYQKQGAAANNFLQTMPVNDARKAVGMFKDEYLLDYINVEEIEVDKSEDIDEKVGGIFCYHMQRYKKYNTGNQIVGKSGCFGLNLSDNSVMRGRVHARRTLKGLVADLRTKKNLHLFVIPKKMCSFAGDT